MNDNDEPVNDEAVYITDLARCQPQSCLSESPKRRAWHVQPYETAELSGNLLSAGEETAAPDVSLGLALSGWHRIFVGVYPDHRGLGSIELKLSGDPCYTHLNMGPDWTNSSPHGQSIYELFWKDADLTGREISIRQVCTPTGSSDEPAAVSCQRTKVAYVKLVPMSEGLVREVESDRRRKDTRRLFAHNDAHGYLFLYGTATEAAVRNEIEPYRHTDFSRLYWECGAGDLMFYLGQVGRLPACDGIEDFDRQGDRLHAETWRSFRAQRLDPFVVALEAAREIGLSFHASYRPAGFFYPPPLEQWNPGSLYFSRPDLRMVGKDGRIAPRISYAFADTRRFVINLLLEVAQHPVDGICILYNRRPPLVDYEPPLVEGFIEAHGEDPRRLADDNPRWLAYRSVALTEFHRELREALDELAREQGRDRIMVSACVLNREENFRNGLDLEGWIAEGLIDTLIPYTDLPELDSMGMAWEDEETVGYFVRLVEGTPCQLALNVMPRHMPPELFRRKAASLYAQGVENLFFWDSAGPSGRAHFGASWDALRRLGHRDEIDAWLRDGEPSLRAASTQLRKLGDYDLTYQTPG